MASTNRMAPRTFEDARIVFRNFKGKEGQYNAKGDRNFALILADAVASEMEAEGWNVKFLKPREEGDIPTPYIQVSVKYSENAKPPRVVMVTSRGKTPLTEEEIEILDWADINSSDLIIRPYQWEVNGNTGVKAYLSSIFVNINEDELELKYADLEDTGQAPAATPHFED